MKPYHPQKIYVEKGTEDSAHVGRILARLPGIPVEEIEKGDSPLLRGQVSFSNDPIGEGKRCLLLARDRGRAFKPFPTPEGTVSCNFYSLNLVEGCDLECSYCILQAYLTNPLLTVYVNTEEILARLEEFLAAHRNEIFRIGTGQLADSLSLDPLTAHTELLVPFFARQSNAFLELKTKSLNIDRLQKLDPGGRTIVSWSMNTRRIQREEEHKCATIEERIEAARQCLEWGYRVGFHLDPLVDYEGCLEDYREVLEMIFTKVRADQIAWVSLGTLRFLPELKPVMEKRFPRSPLPQAEWVRGLDGKMRYFKERRIELYSELVRRLNRLAGDVPVYLCMETEEVWRRVFGVEPNRQMIVERLNCLTPFTS